jgi:putative ABC transport system permease protein
MLFRRPGLAITLVLTLALGTGATTALFSVLDAGLLRPLPYPGADRLLLVGPAGEDGVVSAFAVPYLPDLRERVQGVEGLAGFSPSWGLTLTGMDEPRRLVGAYVSDGVFELLGVRPLAGRTFNAAEHAPGGPRAVVVSLPFWERYFGTGATPAGQTLRLDGEAYEIVGVLPSFPLPITSSVVSRDGDRAELWLPFSTNAFFDLRIVPVMNVIGRLPAGTGLDAVRAELDGVGRRLAADYPEGGAWTTVSAETLERVVTRDSRTAVLTLFGAAAFLLLIACANVANLLLARASARAHELAVRRSLGAGKRQIVEQLLTESLVIATLGSAAGLLVAWSLLGLVPDGWLAALPPSAQVRIDLRVAGFALALAVATTVAFGLVPAALGAWSDAGSELRDRAGGSGRGGKLRKALVTLEVAMAVTLLVGAGLLGKSFWRLVNVDPGFRTEGLLSIPVPMSGERYAEAAQRRAFLDELVGELGALPGVTRVGAVNRLPLGGGNVLVGVEAEGVENAGGQLPTMDRRVATPDYFAVMGIEVAAGRPFAAEDADPGALPATVVNEAFARRFWPGTTGLGQRLRLALRSGPGPWLTVVGVVADVRHHGLDRPAEPEIYVPYAQSPVESMTVLLETGGDPAALAPAARDAIWRLDPDLPLDGTGPLTDVVSGSVAEPRFRTLVLNGFAGLALLLAGIGIYGVLSYSVAQRRRDMGLRIALGATTGSVVRRVVGEGLRAAGLGVVLGLGGALLLGRVLSGFLFGVQATDPVTFLGVAALLLAVAATASWLPARRAAGVDPVRVLSGD